jgi:hypothetical protein
MEPGDVGAVARRSSELQLERHLVLRHRTLAYHAVRPETWTTPPSAICWTSGDLAGLDCGAGLLSEAGFVWHCG